MITKTPWRKALVATAASTSLFLVACGDGGAGGDMDKAKAEDLAAADLNETPREELKDGGTLTTALLELSPQQNRFHADATAYTTSMWRWYNPSLALFDGEGNYSPNPEYISEVTDEEVDGNTVVTFTIVDEATFNDGTPIDWTAFETTWHINNGEDEAYNPNSTDGYERITSVEAGDNDKQAVIIFDGPYPWWEGLFNDLAHPALKDPQNYNDYLNKLHPEWGAGPFKVESYDPQRGEVSFVPNEKWWGDEPKLDRRVIRALESSAEINAFRNGELDATGVANKDRYATVSDMDGIDIRTSMTPSNALFTLNSRAPMLEDPKVREAIARGINREQLGEIRFNGIPYEETPPGSLTIYPTQEGYEDNFGAVVDFNPEEAKKLLDEAGWVAEGDDPIRVKDGKKLSMRYTLFGDDETSRAMAVATQTMMKDLGIDLQIDSRPSSDFSKVVTSYDFDILPMGFSSSDPYGVAYFAQTYRSDSQLNRSGTGNEEFDKKILELQSLPTAEEQIERANELEKEAFQLYGLIPFANGASMVAVKEGLANYGAGGFSVTSIEDIGWEAE